ncbi:MAG: YihY/virulence factor BrkB family protein [Firmicutes bacterium]|nr:YihY/virulence factor BrkB family protein [Bacillota bacterium]
MLQLSQGLCSTRTRAAWLLQEMQHQEVLTYAAAVAYRFGVAFLPCLVGALALLGVLHVSPPPGLVTHGPLARVVPRTVRHTIAAAWLSLAVHRHPALFSAGEAGFVVGMAGVVRQLEAAMDRIAKVPWGQKPRGWRSYVRSLILGIGLGVVVMGGLGILSLPLGLLARVLPVPLRLIGPLRLGRWGILILGVGFLSEALYVVLPHCPRTWRWVDPGAFTAVALWVAGSAAFSLYLAHVPTYQDLYGGLAAILIGGLYAYWVALAFLLGAVVSMSSDDHGSGMVKSRRIS